jgi:hypothetical protein
MLYTTTPPSVNAVIYIRKNTGYGTMGWIALNTGRELVKYGEI